MGFEEDLKNGHKTETKVLKYFKSKGMTLKRGDSENLKNPDLKSIAFWECKRRRTPFRQAKKRIGLLPEKTIVIDVSKLIKYKSIKAPVFIIFDVNYKPTYKTCGLYLITIQKVRKLYNKHPERLFKIKRKDGCVCKFHISIDECINIKDLFG